MVPGPDCDSHLKRASHLADTLTLSSDRGARAAHLHAPNTLCNTSRLTADGEHRQLRPSHRLVARRLAKYTAPESSVFRGMMSEGCRLELEWDEEADDGSAISAAAPPLPSSAFYKRVSMGDLQHARAKALAAPLKLARDVRSYSVESAFLGSAGCAALGDFLLPSGVHVARAYHVERRPCESELIESRFAMLLTDFSPADGWRQSGMLSAAEARAALGALARFHGFFWEGSDVWRGSEAASELEEAVWSAGGYWQPSMQPEDQWAQLPQKWTQHYTSFGAAFADAPELAHIDLPTLGERLQAVATELAALAHPFDSKAGGDAAANRKHRTIIHGDPKSANLFLRDGTSVGALELGLIDFQWSGMLTRN